MGATMAPRHVHRPHHGRVSDDADAAGAGVVVAMQAGDQGVEGRLQGLEGLKEGDELRDQEGAGGLAVVWKAADGGNVACDGDEHDGHFMEGARMRRAMASKRSVPNSTPAQPHRCRHDAADFAGLRKSIFALRVCTGFLGKTRRPMLRVEFVGRFLLGLVRAGMRL